MSNKLTYKGYTASIEYDADSHTLYGIVEMAHYSLVFKLNQASTVTQDFHKVIDEYLGVHKAYMSSAVEPCPHCDHENEYAEYDVNANGYIVRCKGCDKEICLCDECLHAEDNPEGKCDWCETPTGGRCMRGITGAHIWMGEDLTPCISAVDAAEILAIGGWMLYNGYVYTVNGAGTACKRRPSNSTDAWEKVRVV